MTDTRLEEAFRRKQLIDAEGRALALLERIETKDFIQAGRTEREVERDILALAGREFGIEKHWNKRIVRAGANTTRPRKALPPAPLPIARSKRFPVSTRRSTSCCREARKARTMPFRRSSASWRLATQTADADHLDPPLGQSSSSPFDGATPRAANAALSCRLMLMPSRWPWTPSKPSVDS